MFVLVPLDRVQMNPWQPRQSHDEAHIAALAADIQARAATKPDTLGLLQLPAGRIVGADGRTPVTVEGRRGINFSIALVAQDAWVQLAYGHSRFAAFCMLAKTDKRFAKVPVELIAWNDEEMATSAWSENEARSALNPLEKAMALQRYMQDFGWTQQALAERLNLDRSTIANTIRLLKLPPEAQALLATGALSGRQAAALVPLVDLPAPALARAEHAYEQARPSQVFAAAPTLSSDAIRQRVHQVINYATRDLALAVFPLDTAFVTDDVVSPTCSACPIRVRRDQEQRCPDDACYHHKWTVWKAQQLQQASAAMGGAPIADTMVAYNAFTVFVATDPVQTIRQQGCDRLHVQWTDHGPADHTGVPHCRLICVHGASKPCTCLQQAKIEAQAADPDVQARKEQMAAAQALIDQSVQAVYDALVTNELGVWRGLGARLGYQGDVKKTAALDMAACQQAVARGIVTYMIYARPNVDAVRDELAKLLDRLDIPRPWERPTPADIEKKLARIEGWLAGAHHEPPTPAALRGNLDNLDTLLFEELPGVPGADRIGARIMSAQVTICEMLQQHEDVGAQTPDAVLIGA